MFAGKDCRTASCARALTLALFCAQAAADKTAAAAAEVASAKSRLHDAEAARQGSASALHSRPRPRLPAFA